MSGRAFLDTNVFVYNFDAGAPAHKRQVARRLIQNALQHRQTVVSDQVAQEFVNVARNKFATPLSVPDLQLLLQRIFDPLLVVHSSLDLFRDALDIHARFQISWYDALIVASAASAGCSVLYSEDLPHGAKIAGVKIENPFRVS
jgi:predicted nucleic acid-binding protein